MNSVWDLGSLNTKQFGKRIWKEFLEDGVLDQAAQLSFYLLLAVFPLLLFLTALLGMVLGSVATLHDALLKYLQGVAPQSVSGLLDSSLRDMVQTSGGGKLSLGLVAALWAASSGMAAIIESLNIIYDVEEARSWWKRRVLALLLTVVVLTLMFSALALLLYGPAVINWASAHLGLAGVWTTVWRIGEWLLLLGFTLGALNLLYVYAPNIRHHYWHWLMPGTVVGLGLWLLVSYGFKLYLAHFNNFSFTYGSIGTVIILILWFYLSSIAILIGAEVNSEIVKLAGLAGEQKEGKRSGGRG